MWLHSLKVAQLLRSAVYLHTNQSRSYLNHLVGRSVSDGECRVLTATLSGGSESYGRVTRGHVCHLKSFVYGNFPFPAQINTLLVRALVQEE